MNLLVECGRPISFLIIVVIIPFLYVLFSDKAIKGTLLTWGFAVLYALAWTRMEGFFKDYKPELSEFFFYRGNAFVMSVSFGWFPGLLIAIAADLSRRAIQYFEPSAFSGSLNRLRLTWYSVTVLALAICLITAFIIAKPPCRLLNGYISCYLIGLGSIAIPTLSVISYLLIRILKRNLKVEE